MMVGGGFSGGGGGGAPANGASSAFDPAQSAVTVTLSNADRRATISGIIITGRAYCLAGKSSGKFYMEFTNVSQSAAGSPRYGIAPAGASLVTGVGFGIDEWAIATSTSSSPLILNNNTNAPFGTAIINGDIIGIAVEFATLEIWFARNNVWQNSGDPAAGTNPAATISAATTYFPCVSYSTSGIQTAIIDSPAAQTYTPPAGFSVWS